MLCAFRVLLFEIQSKGKMMKKMTVKWVAAVVFGAAVCGAKPLVFVSVLPQADFVEHLAGDRVGVEVLVRPGESPATYEPTPRQMAALSRAKLFFRIGMPFEEALLPKIKSMMKGLRIVDTRKGIALRRMKGAGGHDGHGDEGLDPHIWTNPRLVKIQARTMVDALEEIDPAGKETYEEDYRKFAAALDALDAKLAKALKPVRGRTFLVFHPAWGYFADAYGLVQEPIQLEGKTPSARQLARIISKAKKAGAKVIFVQPQFSQSKAEAIAKAIGGAVVPIDPLARDYIANMEEVAEKVREGVGGN
jgi:zinc transport system substrate-binding protein